MLNMTIPQALVDDFIKKSRYTPWRKICASLLTSGKPYSLNSQLDYNLVEALPENIKACVKAYTHDKDGAIEMFKAFTDFLAENGIHFNVVFPPIPVSSSFERLMFISKYLQEPVHTIAELPDVLWVSDRTIEEDLKRLRGVNDPIQVCGRRFSIPDTERHDGQLTFASTAHPLFLTENLTQVLVMLKGLKLMSENPLYRSYAEQTASEIWEQLSLYAKNRIHFVLGKLLPEDLSWYDGLKSSNRSFYTEEMCSRVRNDGASVVLNCFKNGKTFCVEYDGHLYQNCVVIQGTFKNGQLEIDCSDGR